MIVLLYRNTKCLTWFLEVIQVLYKQDWVGPAVVDGVLEDIRIGLEINHPKFNQRRVASAKYLGELYNYRVIESTIIFKVMLKIQSVVGF